MRRLSCWSSTFYSGLDGDALTIHVAQFAQTLTEDLEAALSQRIRRGTRIEITYPGHLLRELGRSRAAE
jgi:hypothetical protein